MEKPLSFLSTNTIKLMAQHDQTDHAGLFDLIKLSAEQAIKQLQAFFFTAFVVRIQQRRTNDRHIGFAF